MTIYKIVNDGGNGTTTRNSIAQPASVHPALQLIESAASSLTVDPDASILSYYSGATDWADALHLGGTAAWTVTINGFVSAGHGTGLRLFGAPATGLHKVAIGAEGALQGSIRPGEVQNSVALYAAARTDVTNSGLIAAEISGVYQDGNGDWKIDNKASGVIQAASASVSVNGDWAIYIRGTGKHTITNAGRIEGEDYAIMVNDSNGESVEVVKNAKGATISGRIELGGLDDSLDNAGVVSTGISTGDGNDKVINSGTIDGSVYMFSGDDKLTNSGTIGSFVEMGSDNDTLTNSGTIYDDVRMASGNDTLTNSGTLHGLVTMDDPVGVGNDRLTNSGDVFGNVYLYNGDDTVTNSGTIDGDVDMGDGNDILDNSRGRIRGNITMGEGDDTFSLLDELSGCYQVS